MNSFPVHIVDQNSYNRAQISRAVISAGYHAEIYSSIAELELELPISGVILAADVDIIDEMAALEASLRDIDNWLGIIVTSTNPSIEKAVVAIRDGAMDYLPWPIDDRRLSWAIKQAASTTLRNQEQHARTSSARQRFANLSPRERQILALVADGLTNRMAGIRLGISVRTVEIHRNNAIKKLGVKSTAEAVIAYFMSQDNK